MTTVTGDSPKPVSESGSKRVKKSFKPCEQTRKFTN